MKLDGRNQFRPSAKERAHEGTTKYSRGNGTSVRNVRNIVAREPARLRIALAEAQAGLRAPRRANASRLVVWRDEELGQRRHLRAGGGVDLRAQPGCLVAEGAQVRVVDGKVGAVGRTDAEQHLRRIVPADAHAPLERRRRLQLERLART
eukprot:34918-Pleurochrysis_carterae.AAC.4